MTSTFPTKDAFKDAADEPGASQGEKVHVRVQQRNGRNHKGTKDTKIDYVVG